MSAAPTRREAPLAAALASLLLLSSAPAASATESYGARRTVYYQDTACRLESFREYAYNARSMEVDHTSRQGRWSFLSRRRDMHHRELCCAYATRCLRWCLAARKCPILFFFPEKFWPLMTFFLSSFWCSHSSNSTGWRAVLTIHLHEHSVGATYACIGRSS